MVLFSISLSIDLPLEVSVSLNGEAGDVFGRQCVSGTVVFIEF